MVVTSMWASVFFFAHGGYIHVGICLFASMWASVFLPTVVTSMWASVLTNDMELHTAYLPVILSLLIYFFKILTEKCPLLILEYRH